MQAYLFRRVRDALWRLRRFVRFHDERGQSMVWFIAVFPLLMMFIVLVVDGGQMYLEYIRARKAANLAAQAGAQSVDIGRFITDNEIELDPDGALWTMDEYMGWNSVGRQGQITNAYHVSPDYARACTRTEVPTLFFRLFGVNTLSVGACARAYPAHGITVNDRPLKEAACEGTLASPR
jgi:Flp pilus assembly protein TadG